MKLLLGIIFLTSVTACVSPSIIKGGYVNSPNIRYSEKTQGKYEVKCPAPAVTDDECAKSYSKVCTREGFAALKRNEVPWRTCLTLGDIKTGELSDYCYTQATIHCM